MKKLFNFKNIMFVVCVGIAIISTFFSCEVRAYTNEDLTNFIDQLLLNDNVNSTTRERLGILKNNLNSLFTYMSNNNIDLSNYKGFSFDLKNRQGAFNFYLITDNTIPSFENVSFMIKNYDYIKRDNYGYYTLYLNDTTLVTMASNDSSQSFRYFGLLDGLFDNIQPFGNLNYFDNYYTPVVSFDFSPYGFQLSGDSATYWNKFSYVSGFIPLGVLGLNEYYQLDLKLRNSNGYDVANYSDVPGVGSISDDNSIMKVENSVVYVNAIYLSYYSNYNLLFKVYDNSNDFETYIYAYQFMPFSAVIENGEIVSSGDTTFSGVDSTILINENLNDWSQIGLIMRQFGSGDFISSGDDEFNVSGDLFTLLGYSDYDNSYKDFVYIGIYKNLKDVFLSSNDREFTFNFMGSLITINSNQFTTPNGVLKTFVSSFLVFGTFYYFYKTTIHFYHKMQEGNQLEAVQTWSIDDESILM